MKSLTRWPVTVSYFNHGVCADRGRADACLCDVVRDCTRTASRRALVLDYNDFVISGALGKFDVKDSKPCK